MKVASHHNLNNCKGF